VITEAEIDSVVYRLRETLTKILSTPEER
jgi:hypothetical protein